MIKENFVSLNEKQHEGHCTIVKEKGNDRDNSSEENWCIKNRTSGSKKVKNEDINWLQTLQMVVIKKVDVRDDLVVIRL